VLVRDYMPTASNRLVTILGSASIRDAARELARPGIDLIIVADDAGMLSGVVTDSDIVGWVADHGYVAADASVTTLMSKGVFSCKAGDSLTEIAEMAQRKGLKHLPVIDDRGKAIGVIYVREALGSLLQEAAVTEQWLKSYLSGTVNRAPPAR
jgi:CBS domain-containing protein